MKIRGKASFITLAVLVTLALTAQAALADYVSFTGTVASSERTTVVAPIGGTIDTVNVIAGERVEAGDVLATFETTKVYASEDGTVTGIFAQAGDSADTVTTSYGAVLYVEPVCLYTIAASTDNAYSAEENKFVHVGEAVYLKGYSDSSHTGTGAVTAVTGTDFTVRVDSGSFLVGETVTVYRSEGYESKSRIGRGDIARIDPTAYTGTGSVVSVAVEDGATVKKGDLLFETLEGTFDAYYMSGLDIVSPVRGTVAEVMATEDTALSKGASAFVLYPDSAMRIEASVPETDLGAVAVGDSVEIEFTWNDDDVTYPGTIEMISAIATTGEEGVTYPVYISFTADETVKYGMTVVVSSPDEEDAETAEAQSADETSVEDETTAEDEAPSAGEMPAEGEMPGEDAAFVEGEMPDGVTPSEEN